MTGARPATITDMTTKLTTSQQQTLAALYTITNGRLSRNANTSDIAYQMQSNNLAVTASLNALVKAGLVRVVLVSNAAPTGGAYKNAYHLTGRGKAAGKQMIHHNAC